MTFIDLAIFIKELGDMYEGLQKLSYKNPEKIDEIYKGRFSSEFTRHFDIAVQQYGRQES